MTPLTAAAGTPRPVIVPGQTVVYSTTFDGHFWDGEKRHEDATVTVAVKADRSVSLQTATGTEKSNAVGVLRSDGGLDVKPSSGSVADLNAVAAMLQGMTASPKVGDAWRSAIVINTSPTATTSVSVDVKVASVDGDRVLLQATGTKSATTSYSGMSIPIELTVRISALVANDGLRRANGAVDELVQAGPQTQKLGWVWSLAPVAK